MEDREHLDPEFGSPEEQALEQQFESYLGALESGTAPDLDEFLKQVTPGQGGRLKSLIQVLTSNEQARGQGPPPVDSGREVGDCRIISLLGRGGTGSVWLAEQKSTGRLVALKMLHAGVLATERSRQRFEREWRSIAKLHHPNIVPLYTAGEYHGAPYFAMGRVDGRSLSDVLGELKSRRPEQLEGADLRRAVTVDRPATAEVAADEWSIFRRGYAESVCRLTIRMAEALDHAHEAGLIHRDIKPSNILITHQGVPMLLDFGLAHDEKSTSITLTGEFAGTYHYVSPEQAAASRMGIDRRTDVYSLGVVLYQLLTLKLPFDGSTPQEIIKQVLVKEPLPPRRLNPQIPRDLEMIVLKAMDKDPDRRYATAKEFAEDLQNFVDLKPVHARPLSAGERLRRVLRRNPVPVGAVVVVALAFTAMLCFLWWGEHRRHLMAVEQLKIADEHYTNDRIAEARTVYLAILNFAPGTVEALDGLRNCEVAAKRTKNQAAQDLSKASVMLQSYARGREEGDRLRQQVRGANVPGYRAPEENRRIDAAARQLEGWRKDRERIVAKIQTELEHAKRFDPENPDIREMSIQLFSERWHEAVAESDTSQQSLALFELNRLGASDVVEGLKGNSSLLLTGEPAGAKVYLFRYQRQYEFRDGGDQRLVPVPYDGRASDPSDVAELADRFWPGDICAVVSEITPGGFAESEGITRGDLVLALDGRPVDESVLVRSVLPGTDVAEAGVQPFDRLAAVNDRSCISSYDIDPLTLLTRLQTPGAVTLQFARRERALEPCRVRVQVMRGLQEDSGLSLGDAAQVLSDAAPTRDLVLRCVITGDEREIKLPAGTALGAQLELTAYPLVFSEKNLIGELPRVASELEAGSYLAVVRHDGHADLRLPLCMEARKGFSAAVTMRREQDIPPGFVYVPAGSYQAGDPEATASTEPVLTAVDDYYIARREVTLGEYLQFLNDPRTIGLRRRGKSSLFVPRNGEQYLDGFSESWDGTFAVSSLRDRNAPVIGISWDDANEYCKWRSERAAAEGIPWRYTLPTLDQWEKAARGVDGRAFPWGNHFDWGMTKSIFARSDDSFSPESVGRFATDESPFGLRDTGGNAAEWATEPGRKDDIQFLRGGDWGSTVIDRFRAGAVYYSSKWTAFTANGFRLCAVPAGP